MNISLQALPHFTHVRSIINSNSDTTLKTRAFDIGLHTISSLVGSLDDHAEVQARWKDLEIAWETTQSNEERTVLFRENRALLQKVSDLFTSRMPTISDERVEESSSLFQKNGQTLQGLISRLKNLLRTFQSDEQRGSIKMTLLKALDGTISYAIQGLDGRAYAWLGRAWEELIEKMQNAKSELEQATFIKEACPVLASLVERAQEELELVEHLHTMVDTPRTHEDYLSLWQQDEVKAILAKSLSWLIKRERDRLPHTFQAIDILILHVLKGDYGKEIREHLLVNGFFAQEHLLALLLVDCVRNKRPIHTVEIFREVAPEIDAMLQQTRVANDALFQWLSTNDATLPEAHTLFMRVISAARFDDEKEFAYLRESARRLYAPSLKNLVYLALHSNTEEMLQVIQPFVEKNLFTALQRACEIITHQDEHTIIAALLSALKKIGDEHTQHEWFGMVIMGIARERGALAIRLTHAFIDEEAPECTGMLREIIVTYAERHFEEAKALLSQFTDEQRQSLLYSIAAFHAKETPQLALSIIDELMHRNDVHEILALIAQHQIDRFGLEEALRIIEIIPQGRKAQFYAHLVIALSKESGLRSACQAILPRVGEAHDACIMHIACQIARDGDGSLVPPFSTLVKALGTSHQDLFQAGILMEREFSALDTPEVANEELDMLEQIADDTLLGKTLLGYVQEATVWLVSKADPTSAAEYQKRVMRLLLLAERVRSEESHDLLHEFLASLVVLFDKGLALRMVGKIHNPSVQKMALCRLISQLDKQVAHCLAHEMYLTLEEKELPFTSTLFHALPTYLDDLSHMVTVCAGDDASFPKTLQIHFVELWGHLSSKKALALFDGASVDDTEKRFDALSSIAIGHFSRYNSEPGDIDCILQLFPDPEQHPLDMTYSALTRLLVRKGDVERAMAITGRMQNLVMKASCLARIIHHLCIRKTLDEKVVSLLESTFKEEKLRQSVISLLLDALDPYIFEVLKEDLEEEEDALKANITGKIADKPTNAAHPELQSLVASLDPIYRLIKSWAVEDVSAWHERLAFIYAPFSSAKAIELFDSAQIEDVELSKQLLQHIARTSLSPHNIDGKKELDTILERLMQKPREHAASIAALAVRLIARGERVEKALASLRLLLRDPHIAIHGQFEQELFASFQELAASYPNQCLSLLREIADPVFLGNILTMTVIPHLFHSGLLQHAHADLICALAKKCDADDADDIYSSLATGYAKDNEELASALMDKIGNIATKQACADHVNRILTYRKLYPVRAKASEAEQAAFAIKIAPYLRREAFDIAKKLSSPALATHILQQILKTTMDNKTEHTLRHYRNDIQIIIQQVEAASQAK